VKTAPNLFNEKLANINPSPNLAEEELRLGKWPRRLLYVPTMASYEWQPGNTYKNTPEPEYNAIS
jgi:hypothetical protein